MTMKKHDPDDSDDGAESCKTISAAAPNTGEKDEVSSVATMKASNVTGCRTSMV